MDAGCSFEPPDIGTWSRDPLGDFVDVLVFFVLLTQVGPGSVVRKSGSGDQSCLLTCVLLLEGGGHVLSRPLSLVHWWHGAACHSSLSAGAAFSSCCRRVFFYLVCVSTTTWTRDGVCFLPLRPWSDGGLARACQDQLHMRGQLLHCAQVFSPWCLGLSLVQEK